MQPSPPANPHEPAAGAPRAVVDARLLGQALGCGILVAAAGVGTPWLFGLVPGDLGAAVAVGGGAAIFAAMAGVWIHGRFLAGATEQRFRGDGRLLAGHLQGLLAAAFVVKLVVLTAGVLVCQLTGVQFRELAGFCIAFAAVSLLCQVTTAGYLARAIRSPRPPAAPHPAPRPATPR